MRARTLIAGVLIVVGLVWIGQGTRHHPGQRVHDRRRQVGRSIGAVLLAVGVVVAVTVVRSRPKA